jgi:hypothetical protein
MSHRFTEPTPTSLAGRHLVEVFVAGWEVECCAPPPVVGESTTWTLGFSATTDECPSCGLDRDRTWQVVRHETWTAVADGPVVACWNDRCGRPPGPGRHALRGYLVGSVHGLGPDDVPPTTGTVQRVRLATEVFRLDDERTLRPVAGTLELVDVARSPRSFSTGDRRIEPGVDLPMQTGVLVEVSVPGTAK